MTLVLGGAASGKSEFAEKLIGRRGPAILYLATSLPSLSSSRTPEWRKKIEAHRRRRPAGWTTEILNGRPVDKLIGYPTPDGILLDSLTLWVSTRMRNQSEKKIRDEMEDMVRRLRGRSPLVVVSDEVGLGVVPHTASGRKFLGMLGRLNAELARVADRVYFVVSGQALQIKPARR